MERGKLYLIPTPLGETSHNGWIDAQFTALINSIGIYIVEEIRTARRFLKKAGFQGSIDELVFKELNEHTQASEINGYLNETLKGADIGLLSEAGVPCIADPGNLVVMQAHKLGTKVIPLIGPSSITMALMASGLNGQQFSFHGYLPVKPHDRISAIRRLEKESFNGHRAQVFIETPYRNNSMFESLTKNCLPDTYLCIATDINQEGEFIRTLTIREWKLNPPDIQKRPTVYIISA